MGLEDDLKARTSALISQQMANWVVEIQRAIQGHQANLVSALDELGEQVARYDEKVDESAIASAMAEVVAQQPPAAAAADYSALKSSISLIEISMSAPTSIPPMSSRSCDATECAREAAACVADRKTSRAFAASTSRTRA